MSNPYTQIHIQFVFAVKFRRALIDSSWKDELHKYITGMIQNKTHKMLQINTMPDHLHMLIGFRPNENMSQLIQVVKSESTKWVNDTNRSVQKFAWQDGFGGFSYSKSHVPDVIRYIQNQEQHHKKQTFLEEYVSFLKAFEIEYDERYILKATHVPSLQDGVCIIVLATDISSLWDVHYDYVVCFYIIAHGIGKPIN